MSVMGFGPTCRWREPGHYGSPRYWRNIASSEQFPNEKQKMAALKLLKEMNVTNITVKVVKP